MEHVPDNLRRGTSPIFGALVFSGAMVASSLALAQTDMALTISADKHEYVYREPIKVTMTLKNISDKELRLPRLCDLSSVANWSEYNNPYIVYDVVTPGGDGFRRQRYKPARTGDRRLALPGEDPGDPLAPDRSVSIFLYPVVMQRMPGKGENVRDSLAFTEIGRYSLRVVYRVDPSRTLLWKPPGGELSSNAIEIWIRRPMIEERNILDAVWLDGKRGGYLGPIEGDQDPWWHNEAALRDVIRKYRKNPLIAHAYLALAKSRCFDSHDKKRVGGAIPILEMLIEDYPDFRFEETRQHLGYAYHAVGRYNDATRLFQDTLAARPELYSNWSFMWTAIWATENKPSDWLELRREGKEITRIDFGAIHVRP